MRGGLVVNVTPEDRRRLEAICLRSQRLGRENFEQRFTDLGVTSIP
jgi:hypothetical protein